MRLLRLGDQYFQVGAVMAGGWLVRGNSQVLWWLLATVLLSCPTFIVNELVDRGDVDRFSWNGVHVKNEINLALAGLLFVTLSIAGLALAYFSGKFFWGLSMYVLAMMYSLPVVRLKARPVVDVLSQEAVWWAIPFLGITWGKVDPWLLAMLTGFGGCVMWCGFFPYQMADVKADLKAGLNPTHVWLGMRKSLILGFMTGVVAWMLFLVGRIDRLVCWSWAFVLLTTYILWQYGRWMKMRTLDVRVKSMQSYVRFTKPLTQVMVAGLALIYLWR